MTTGDSLDIQKRIKGEIPKRWFSYVAPNRDAIIGSISDLGAWCYNWIAYAKAQTRLATAYGIWLDIFAFDFLGNFLTRNSTNDNVFRKIIRATILQERVTRAGMIGAITTLTGNPPWIFEPWNTLDTGAYSGSLASGAPQYGQCGYGVGTGGYGNMNLPAQCLMRITVGLGVGPSNVAGYGDNIGGYGVGQLEYIGSTLALNGITEALIYNQINMTKPTGTFCWVAIDPILPIQKVPCMMVNATNSQNIVII